MAGMGRVRVDNTKTFYAFSHDVKPVVRVKPGTVVEIETKDCFSNQLVSEEQLGDFQGASS